MNLKIVIVCLTLSFSLLPRLDVEHPFRLPNSLADCCLMNNFDDPIEIVIVGAED